MAQPAASPNASATKPEGLPDQFWDATAGTVKFDDLGKAFNDLSAFQAEQQSRAAAVPEKAEGYELKLPSDVKMPDGYDFALDANDPMVALGREVAKAAGLDQTGFENLVGKYAQFQSRQAADIAAAEKRQLEALGPQGPQRVGAVTQWLAAKIGPDAPQLMEYVLKTKSGVEMFERIIRMSAGGGAGAYSPAGREVGARNGVDGWDEMTPGQKFLAAKRG